MRATIKRLTEELAIERRQRADEVMSHEVAMADLGEAYRQKLTTERTMRMSAQRGLVPYVRGLEAFNAWLRARPELSAKVEGVMRELGLWDIRLGYDPDQDLRLTVLSPDRL